MASDGAYRPYLPATRPGRRPSERPGYRVLIHRQFKNHYEQLPSRIGLEQAQRFWDHLATSPGVMPATAGSCILKGRAGQPSGPGWSRTVHYELSSMARANYQYNDAYTGGALGDPHPVVRILTLDFSSH